MRHSGFVGAGTLVGLVAIAVSATMLFTIHVPRHARLVQAHAFACGYLYGQRGIIKAAHLQTHPPDPGPSCPAIRDNAGANGFPSADKD